MKPITRVAWFTTALAASPLSAAPVISNFTDLTVTEQDPATLISETVDFAAGGNYTDGSLTFSLAGATSEDSLVLSSDADPNASGAISVLGSDVYLGNGAGTDRIGAIDATANGQAGNDLTILFSSPLANSSFETGTTEGWTVFNQAWPDEAGLNGNSMPWVRSSNSTSGTGSIRFEGIRSMNYSITTVTNPVSKGTYSLRLFSQGGVTCTAPRTGTQPTGYCSAHGPYVESTAFDAEAGDQLFFDWSAQNGGDWYEVLGYLIGDGADDTFGTGDDTRTLLFSQRGDIQSFKTETTNITSADTYKFQFISGTYDASGGLAVGASLYIDNVRVVSSTAVTDTVALNIARLVTFQNSSDAPPASRVLTLTGVAGDGQSTSASVNINITPVNDPPVFTASVANQTLIEGDSISTSASATDVDLVDTLTYSVSNAPDFVSIDPATGVISGTSGAGDAGNYDVTVSVSDGTVTISQTFALEVLPDLDGDGITDAQDPDIDGDGLPNAWETLYGLNPSDSSDASLDSDGDGTSNLDEFGGELNPTLDDVAPLVTAPADLTVDSTQLFTPVDLGMATALDALDGEVPAISDRSGRFPPGEHEIRWYATDAAGNVGEAIQILKVRPIVSFSKDQTIGEDGSPTVTVGVHLNGSAADYPVTVAFDVAGTASNPEDHNLSPGEVIIANGTYAGINLTIVDDGAGDDGETIELAMTAVSNAIAGDEQHLITLSEVNERPRVSLSAMQNGRQSNSLVVQGNGPVTVTASVRDPNTGDTHTYDWSETDTSLSDQDAAPQTFIFDPATLSPGLYDLAVTVTDSAAAPLMSTAVLTLNLIGQAPALAGSTDSDSDGIDDATEGFGDSDSDGVPDYLDAVAESNVVSEQSGNGSSFLMETNPGLRLSLGRSALLSGQGASSVSAAQVETAQSVNNDSVSNVGGYFDFEIADIPVSGQSVQIVLAQFAPIPERPVYRKLLNGEWRNFEETSEDSLMSAPGAEGFCPPPGDGAYEDGLVPGYWCVQLTVQDGGPNDADGEANGRVVDPGGVGSLSAVSAKSTSGSGSTSGIFLLLLAPLMLLRRRRLAAKAGRCLLGLVIVFTTFFSRAETPFEPTWIFGAQLLLVEGDESGDQLNAQIDNLGLDAEATSQDKHRMGWSVFAGYEFLPGIAAELGYVDLGDAEVRFEGFAADIETFLRDVEDVKAQSASGVTAAASARFPLSENWGGKVRAGAFFWSSDIDLDGGSASRDFSESGTDPFLGVQLTRSLSSALDVGIGWNYYPVDDSKLESVSLELLYRM